MTGRRQVRLAADERARKKKSNQPVHIGAAQWTHFDERRAFLRRDD